MQHRSNLLSHSLLALSIAAANQAFAAVSASEDTAIPTVVVTSGLRSEVLNETPTSVTVADKSVIENHEAVHIEQLVSLAPNVNSTSGASRARFFQIRGIGERSQFIGPINPSVGVIMDGIDLSNIGAAATMMDVQQVEVLRGPQGTLYGSNALAGLINIRSQDPTTTTQGDIEATLGNYNSRSLTAAVGGAINESVGYRVAMQSNKSDGFIENDYLNKDNTNNIDETFLRGKLRIAASDYHMIDLTAFYTNIDNGYDAFSLDNNRITLSDEPGHDRQETGAFAIKSTWSGNDAYTLESSLSYSSSSTEYGYDEDWTYPFFYPNPSDPTEDWGYTSFDNYLRNNDIVTAEMRAISAPGAEIFNGSTQWVSGVYFYDRNSSLRRQYTYLGNDFTSEFDTARYSVYGQLDTALTDRYTLSYGLRLEQVSSEYSDSDGSTSSPDDILLGGKLALEYAASQNTMIYGLVSRGYKVGGVNADTSLSADLQEFDTEYLWNYEVGTKGNWLNNRLQSQIALFYQDRENAQIKGYRTITNPGGGTSFVDFVGNTDKAYSYGIEAEARFQASEAVTFNAAIGILNTKLEDSSAAFDGREAAQSPNYTYTLGIDFDHGQGWFSGVEVEGKDTYYFSDSHDELSDSYRLFNARVGYETKDWSVTLWGKNLTDEDYFVRGFYFGNDPRTGYADAEYTQLGAPRQIGITGKLHF